MFNNPEPNISRYFYWKRYVEIPMVLVLLILALPIIAIAVLLVRLTSKGPGIYKQIRLGLDGKPFTFYKIRSMRDNAEAATGPVWAARNDKRVTPFGKILRQTQIDDLPQLYNVLKGDINLVGPRPERPEFVTELEKRIAGYSYRLHVKPGLTGLSQLNQRSDLDMNDVRRKLVFDFDYIEHCSLWLDMRILFCFLLKMVFLCSPSVLKLLRLHREASQSPWASSLLQASFSPLNDDDEERLSQIILKRTTV